MKARDENKDGRNWIVSRRGNEDKTARKRRQKILVGDAKMPRKRGDSYDGCVFLSLARFAVLEGTSSSFAGAITNYHMSTSPLTLSCLSKYFTMFSFVTYLFLKQVYFKLLT